MHHGPWCIYSLYRVEVNGVNKKLNVRTNKYRASSYIQDPPLQKLRFYSSNLGHSQSHHSLRSMKIPPPPSVFVLRKGDNLPVTTKKMRPGEIRQMLKKIDKFCFSVFIHFSPFGITLEKLSEFSTYLRGRGAFCHFHSTFGHLW